MTRYVLTEKLYTVSSLPEWYIKLRLKQSFESDLYKAFPEMIKDIDEAYLQFRSENRHLNNKHFETTFVNKFLQMMSNT